MLHIFIAWALFLVGLTFPALVLLSVATRHAALLPQSGALVMILLLFVCVAIAAVGVTLFAALWSCYLRFFVSTEEISEVEAGVKKYLQLGLMEPIYSKVKELIYGQNNRNA